MKTILLLMCGLFLISQISFGKEINTNASAGKKDINLERVTFKNSTISKKGTIERNRVWLNFSNAEGAFKQALIGYVTGATNGWDKLYDAVSMDSNPYVDFYSINLGKNLTIQGRGLPFVITDEVPLGYKSNIVGAFNITIDHFDGFFVNQDIFLKDLVTGVTHNLKNGTYSFTTTAGRFNDRFVLLYVNTPPVTPAPPIEPILEEPIVSVPVVPAPIVVVPEVVAPIVTDPIVTVPEVPAPIVTDPIVVVPEVPAPIVTDPIVVVPEVLAPIVTDPIVAIPEVPAPIVTDPIVVVPEVPAPIVTDPIVVVPEVPEPIVTEPIVTLPEVPAPIVTDPIVVVPEVPAPIVSDPIVTVPEVPAPIVTDPIVVVPEVPAPIVTDPIVTVPEVPAPIVTDPIVTVPEVPAPVVIEPIVSVPEIPVFIAEDTVKNNNGKGKSVIVLVDNNQITISSTKGEINEIYVYTMGHKQLFGRTNLNTNEYVITDIAVAKQVLIIKIQLKNGKWTNSKIIL